MKTADAAADPAAARAWIGRFEGLGASCDYLTYYLGDGYPLTADNGALIPAYQSLYDHFSG